MEIFLAILLFLGLTAVGGFIFIIWLSIAAVGLLGRAAGATARAFRPPTAPADPHSTRCPRRSCLGVNPVEAKFCRRCGHAVRGEGRGAEGGRRREEPCRPPRLLSAPPPVLRPPSYS